MGWIREIEGAAREIKEKEEDCANNQGRKK